MDSIPVGNKVAMFLKLTFLESKKRKQLFIDNPPRKFGYSLKELYVLRMGTLKGLKEQVQLPMLGLFGKKGIKEKWWLTI